MRRHITLQPGPILLAGTDLAAPQLARLSGFAQSRLRPRGPLAGGVERYRIGLRERTSDNFRFIEVGKVTSYTVTTLTNGVAYRFQIAALNSNGESKPSEEQTGTPAASD